MSGIRNFTGPEGHFPAERNIDDDAPQPMRQELVDFVFGLAEQHEDIITADRLYRVIGQSLGERIAGDPYGGRRYASGRDIGNVEWPRVYDLICRLWPEFGRAVVGFQEVYREGVNRILAAHGIAWDLGEDGLLHRVMPFAAQAQVSAAFTELSDARYAPALALFSAARVAYDERPRRDRDACSNIFDAMESVAKIRYALPNSTFGQVLTHITQVQAQQQQAQPPQPNTFQPDTLEILRRVNDMRNHHFGHGMAGAFPLTVAEVDFVFLTCIAGILVFTRTP